MLTLLYVEPGKGGLQVEHDGDWIDAPPIDGALVVNIGELLEVATGGYLKATVHRVVSPEATANVSRCRSSSTRTTQRRSRSSTYRPSWRRAPPASPWTRTTRYTIPTGRMPQESTTCAPRCRGPLVAGHRCGTKRYLMLNYRSIATFHAVCIAPSM